MTFINIIALHWHIHVQMINHYHFYPFFLVFFCTYLHNWWYCLGWFRVYVFFSLCMLMQHVSDMLIEYVFNGNSRIQQMEVQYVSTIFEARFSADIPWNSGLMEALYMVGTPYLGTRHGHWDLWVSGMGQHVEHCRGKMNLTSHNGVSHGLRVKTGGAKYGFSRVVAAGILWLCQHSYWKWPLK